MKFSGFILSIWMICLVFIECKKKKIKQKIQTQTNNSVYQYLFIGLGITILLGLLLFLLKKRLQLLRAQKLKSIKRALEVKQLSKKDRSCTMTQMQKDQAIVWLSKQNWILQQTVKKQKSIETQLQTINIKRKQQNIDGSKVLKDYYDAFYITMKGKGRGESFDILGVVMFEKFYMTIVFEKSVSNVRNSEGIYDYKLFEGMLKKGQFEGRWYTSNERKIETQYEGLKQKQKGLEQAVSQKSFSKDLESQQGLPRSGGKRVERGTFRLYHK